MFNGMTEYAAGYDNCYLVVERHQKGYHKSRYSIWPVHKQTMEGEGCAMSLKRGNIQAY